MRNIDGKDWKKLCAQLDRYVKETGLETALVRWDETGQGSAGVRTFVVMGSDVLKSAINLDLASIEKNIYATRNEQNQNASVEDTENHDASNSSTDVDPHWVVQQRDSIDKEYTPEIVPSEVDEHYPEVAGGISNEISSVINAPKNDVLLNSAKEASVQKMFTNLKSRKKKHTVKKRNKNSTSKTVGMIFKCDVCEKVCSGRSQLSNHVKLHSKIVIPHKCQECGKTFRRALHLQKHMEHHNVFTERDCRTCGLVFPSHKAYADHLKMHSKLLACRYCNKLFSAAYLAAHERIHTGEKPYMCDICGNKFVTRTQMRVHNKRHSGERPFTCDICGNKFSSKKAVEWHRKIHTGERPFPCDICGKGFIQKKEMEYHRNTHTGKRPFICDQCGKGFIRKSSLKLHLMMHNGERPYKCKICDRGFSNPRGCRRHEETHSTDKPYRCEHCGKLFKRKDNLFCHMKIHSREKSHVCENCGKRFSDSRSLLRHAKTHARPKDLSSQLVPSEAIHVWNQHISSQVSSNGNTHGIDMPSLPNITQGYETNLHSHPISTPLVQIDNSHHVSLMNHTSNVQGTLIEQNKLSLAPSSHTPQFLGSAMNVLQDQYGKHYYTHSNISY